MMRPTAIEAIRGIQAALLEEIAPEVKSQFAESVLQTLQMLLESLAGEWDTTAEQLSRDNQVLGDLLSGAADIIKSLPARDEELAALVPDIDGLLSVPRTQSLVISEMSATNSALRSALEQLITRLEDVIDDPAYSDLRPIRKAIYEHLRKAAVRGWSVWDAMSFRERMARERTA